MDRVLRTHEPSSGSRDFSELNRRILEAATRETPVPRRQRVLILNWQATAAAVVLCAAVIGVLNLSNGSLETVTPSALATNPPAEDSLLTLALAGSDQIWRLPAEVESPLNKEMQGIESTVRSAVDFFFTNLEAPLPQSKP